MVNSTIFTIIFVCIIGIIVVAINSKMNNTEIELAEKTETKQKGEEQNEPKAITTPIVAGTPNKNNVTYVDSKELDENSNLKKVPVPKGYVASPDAEERYVNGVTAIVEGVTTRESHGGFVIYERLASDAGKTDAEVQKIIETDLDTAQETRNQWVWVPIKEVSNMYHLWDVNKQQVVTEGMNVELYGNQYRFTGIYGKDNLEPTVIGFDTDHYQKNSGYNDYAMKQYLEGISRKDFLEEMREQFHNMLKSVATYGGFYIGRYETGNISSKVPVVRKGNSTISIVNWYLSYKRCKNLKGSSKAVKTGMIWGIQWDETLNWIIDVGEKTPSQIANYTSTMGNYTSRKNETGLSESYKMNNVYDMAGNVWEWTMEMESAGSYRIYRGGSYADYTARRPASNRSSDYPAKEYVCLGARASLYIC